MKKITKQKWVNALRSGKFEQGKGQLCTGDRYCCLGVLSKITGNLQSLPNGWYSHKGGSGYMLSNEDPMVDTDTQGYLTKLNDTDGKSFPEIADWIETNVPTED